MVVHRQHSLITTALRLCEANLLVPLRQTTQTFLSSPRTTQEYNQYLQSISHIPFRTPEATRTVKSILAHIDQLDQRIEISTRTYTRLIHPSFTPVPLLAYLNDRLASADNDKPLPLPILLSFLATYSKLSDPEQASLFYSRIQAHPLTTPETLQHASTLLLSAQPNQQAAYRVLTSSKYDSHRYNSSVSLHILSQDLSVSTNRLIQSFLLLSNQPNPPLLPLYTSLINGLILRKKYRIASTFFNGLQKLSKIDIPSLSAGINALTRAGNPHKAFQLLQLHYPTLLRHPIPKHNPAIPILTFLTALNRISRPDISTLFFFLYPSLYGPSSPPYNAHSLNLLLVAARTGFKMDLAIHRAKASIPDNVKRLLKYLHSKSTDSNSLLTKLNLRTSTLIHQISSSLGDNLAYHHLISTPPFPFGHHKPPHTNHSHPQPRLQAYNLILSHLGHPIRGGPRHFISSSSYKNIPSITWARIVFLQVLAGIAINTPIWDVNPPAISFISVPPPNSNPSNGPNLDSFTHLFSQQQRQTALPYTPSHFQNPTLWENLTRAPNKTPFYPSIIPTNSNFFNYLILLGLSSSSDPIPSVYISPNCQVSPTTKTQTKKKAVLLPPASPNEIPLVIAWMRTLEIQPSKSTLAIALVIWGEVCALVDAHPGATAVAAAASSSKLNPGERQYLLMVSYLREWVGEERLPHWRTLEKWRGVLSRMRVGGDGG